MAVGKLLTECHQKRSGALIKLGDVATKLHNSVEVNVKSLSDDDSYDEEQNISEDGDKEKYLFSSDSE